MHYRARRAGAETEAQPRVAAQVLRREAVALRAFRSPNKHSKPGAGGFAMSQENGGSSQPPPRGCVAHPEEGFATMKRASDPEHEVISLVDALEVIVTLAGVATATASWVKGEAVAWIHLEAIREVDDEGCSVMADEGRGQF